MMKKLKEGKFFRKKLSDSELEEVFNPSFIAPNLEIDLNLDPKDEQLLLEKTRIEWEILGQNEPHWSVLTDPKFKQKSIVKNISEFEVTGYESTKKMQHLLEKVGCLNFKDMSVLELGCGLGRVTIPLSNVFGRVYAVDISKFHLEYLERKVKKLGISTIETLLLQDIGDFERLKDFDVFYSVITLQHNPPPIQKILLEKILQKIKKRGYFVFQIPTYQKDYTFKIDRYRELKHSGMEMHCLPMQEVFSILAENSCLPQLVLRDNYAGHTIESHTFIGRKL